MATYTFKAIDARGIRAQGEVEAEDEATLSSQLRSRGLIVLKIEELKPTDIGDIFGRFKKVGADDLAVMTRQLATMVNSGLPLLRALHVLDGQTSNEKLRLALSDVYKRVEAGGSLSDALAKHPGIFNELYVAMVRAGEVGGLLDATLLHVADQLEKAESLRRQVKSAMIYPVLIGSFAMGILIAMVAFMIPVFEKVLKDVDPTNASLPLPTKLCIAISHFVTGQWYIAVAGTVVAVVGFRRWKGSPGGKASWERFKLKIPFKIGKLIHKVALARFSRTFAGLIGGGVPVLETIEITGRTAGNIVIQEAMDDVRESVRAGGTIAQPMRLATKAFPVMLPQMIEVGESSGNLEDMLDKVADFYEDEVTTSVKSLSALLEPVMLVFVGGIVGFIVLSMYLPLFDIYNKVR